MPKRSFSTLGRRPTGRARIRSGWFGFAVFEIEFEYLHGATKWVKAPGYRLLDN